MAFRATQVRLHSQIRFMINQSNIIIQCNETLYHTVAVWSLGHLPPCCVLTWMFSDSGPLPCAVYASTLMVYVRLVSRLLIVVSWVSPSLCNVHRDIGISGVRV